MKAARFPWLLGGLLGAVTTVTHGAEFKLRPVAASGFHTIIGNQIILQGAGQTVTLEVRADDWDAFGDVGSCSNGSLCSYSAQDCPSGACLQTNGLVRGFFATIDCASFSSGINGPIALQYVECGSIADCQAAFGDDDTTCLRFCNGGDNDAFPCNNPDQCPGGSCDSRNCEAAFLDDDRPDWVFAGLPAITGVSTATCDVQLLAKLFGPSVAYGGIEKYCGTILLQVPADALGEFTISFKPNSSNPSDLPNNFLLDSNNNNILPLYLTPAIITIPPPPSGACCDHAVPGGECTNDVPGQVCLATGEQTEFFQGQTCAAIETAGLCSEHTGACCVEGVCADYVAESACAGENWFKGTPCDDPDVANLCVVPPIPTVSEWGLMILALLLVAGGKVYFGRGRFVV